MTAKQLIYVIMTLVCGVMIGFLTFNCPGFPRWMAWVFTPGFPLMMLTQIPKRPRRWL